MPFLPPECFPLPLAIGGLTISFHNHIVGPLLFLIFINDLPNATDFLTLLFADDTTFQLSDANIDTLIEKCNSELEKAATWFQANKLTLNVKKK